MSVCCECCVLSGRVLCDELITRPVESCRLWCVVVYDLETSSMRRPWPALGHSATGDSEIKYVSDLSSIHSALRQRDRLFSLSFLNVTLEQMLLSLLFLVAHLGYMPSSLFLVAHLGYMPSSLFLVARLGYMPSSLFLVAHLGYMPSSFFLVAHLGYMPYSFFLVAHLGYMPSSLFLVVHLGYMPSSLFLVAHLGYMPSSLFLVAHLGYMPSSFFPVAHLGYMPSSLFLVAHLGYMPSSLFLVAHLGYMPSSLFLVAQFGYMPSSFFRSKIKSEQRTKIGMKAYMCNCPCSGHSGRWFVVGGFGSIWLVSHRPVFPGALRSVTAPSDFWMGSWVSLRAWNFRSREEPFSAAGIRTVILWSFSP